MSEAARPILLVEDEETLRLVVREVLEDEGHVVVEAENGRAALEKLRAGCRPCLILLDLMMPVMTGEQFLHAIRDEPELASIPVVVLSASRRESIESVIAPFAVAGCLQKPVQLPTLLELVRRYR